MSEKEGKNGGKLYEFAFYEVFFEKTRKSISIALIFVKVFIFIERSDIHL